MHNSLRLHLVRCPPFFSWAHAIWDLANFSVTAFISLDPRYGFFFYDSFHFFVFVTSFVFCDAYLNWRCLVHAASVSNRIDTGMSQSQQVSGGVSSQPQELYDMSQMRPPIAHNYNGSSIGWFNDIDPDPSSFVRPDQADASNITTDTNRGEETYYSSTTRGSIRGSGREFEKYVEESKQFYARMTGDLQTQAVEGREAYMQQVLKELNGFSKRHQQKEILDYIMYRLWDEMRDPRVFALAWEKCPAAQVHLEKFRRRIHAPQQ